MEFEYAKDNLNRIPYEFYLEQYRQINPFHISNRLEIPYDFHENKFTLMFLGKVYFISYPDFFIIHEGEEDSYYALEENIYAKILVLRYLLNASIFPHNGDFRSYRELPSGDLYFRQFQGRCIDRLNQKYGNHLTTIRKIMNYLEALSIDQGDAGFELELFDNLYLRFLFWKGDNEFPASSQILFSSNFPAAFSAYDLAEIGDICIHTFCEIEKILS